MERIAGSMAYLPCQNTDVKIGRLLLFASDVHAPAAFSTKFNRLIQEKALVRKITGGSEGNDRIRYLSSDLDAGQSYGSLLACRPKFQIRRFGKAKSRFKV
jgi:hypothetical protein